MMITLCCMGGRYRLQGSYRVLFSSIFCVLVVIHFVPFHWNGLFQVIGEPLEDLYYNYLHPEFGNDIMWFRHNCCKFEPKIEFPTTEEVPRNLLSASDTEDTEKLLYKSRPVGIDFPVYSHQVIDPKCPRFFSLELCDSCGVGHKTSEYLFGHRLAMVYNATYVVDLEKWSWSKHENLDWTYKSLGMMVGEWSVTEVKQKYKPTIVHECPVKWKFEGDGKCNVMYYVRRWPACCEGDGWGIARCFYSPLAVDLFKNASHMLQTQYTAVKQWRDMSVIQKYFTPEAYTVAWHIRVGDFDPHSNDREFFEQLLGTLSKALNGLYVKYYVFSYFAGANHNTTIPPPGYEYLKTMLPNSVFLSNIHTDETITLMAHADMLIGSGSTMVDLPSVLSTFPLTLFHETRSPKHVEHLDTFIELFMDGTLDINDDQFRNRVLESLDRNGRTAAIHKT
eukprot:CFRG0457T1